MESSSGLHQRFESVFGELYRPLCSYAFTFIREADVCEDIVQEVFIRIWETRKDLLTTDNIRFYLFSAVRNNCISHLRRNKSSRTLPWKEGVLPDDLFVHPRGDHDSIQYEKWLIEAIDGLPEKCREVFVLSRISNLRYKEIADVLGISVKTVENQLGKALRLIREFLKKRDIPSRGK
jgi:RNA polymerase sigma-70 factor (ECF subfamily)